MPFDLVCNDEQVHHTYIRCFNNYTMSTPESVTLTNQHGNYKFTSLHKSLHQNRESAEKVFL